MSDTTLDLLHSRLEELRIDSVMIRGRIEELVQTIEMLERRRGGRPRKGDSDKKLMQLCPDGVIRPIEMPQRVAGGIADTEIEDNMRAIDEVRGILKEDVR